MTDRPIDTEFTPEAGSSTDQHVTGDGEPGEFTTGERPMGGTPSHGSSNAGINETRANAEPFEDEQ